VIYEKGASGTDDHTGAEEASDCTRGMRVILGSLHNNRRYLSFMRQMHGTMKRLPAPDLSPSSTDGRRRGLSIAGPAAPLLLAVPD